ncbi:MAG TPA: VCBS repeat-containing protein [Solirubrobacterales bacterium]|nr:VCBS repeat-containing protein [Solirubrobacterales bacterium]
MKREKGSESMMPMPMSMSAFGAIALVTCLALLFPVASASGDASFSSTALDATGTELEDIAVGDLDGHNGPDLVTSYKKGGIGVHLNDGSGHFGPEHLYATGCKVPQVEVSDVGGPGGGSLPDGHPDVAFSCEVSENEVKYLGRMFGDGNGHLSEPQLSSPELSFGPFGGGEPQNHQHFALAEGIRDPALGPVVVWGYLSQYYTSEGPSYTRLLCLSYDWKTRSCTGINEPGIQAPVVAGIVADARVFAGGGGETLLDWGQIPPPWHSSSRDLGPEPKYLSGEANWDSIAIGDLQGDGPDILSSVGRCGCFPGQEGPYGRVSVSYGNLAEGVPLQHATTFPSAPGVMDIAPGDFDRDGHTDVAGTAFHNEPGEGYVDEVFVQPGDGAGHLGAPQHFRLDNEYRYSTGSIEVADFDANGSPDIAAVAGQQPYVLLNQVPPPGPSGPPASGGGTGSPSGSKGGPSTSALGKALTGINGLSKSTTLLANGTVLLGTVARPAAGVTIAITYPPVKVKGDSLLSGRRKGAKKSVKPVRIGTAHIAVPAGKSVPLKVKLSGKALKLLKKAAIRTTLRLSATSTDGAEESETRSLTIKPAKKRSEPAKKGSRA